MTQYIDKDALVAEMENLENTYNKCPTRNTYEDGLKEGRLIGYKDALHKINTLEVKEVELDEHQIADIIQNLFPTDQFIESETLLLDKEEAIIFAKHFFELGLKAQKGE